MKDIFISVSPLSAKILTHKFGPFQPLKIRSGAAEYDLLFLQRDIHDNLKNIEKRLCRVVTVKVPNDRAFTVQKVAHQIGFAFHRLHINEMMVFVLSRWLIRQYDDKSNLLEFYRLYSIEEDDYPLETAYRKWTRYKATHQPTIHPARKTELQALASPVGPCDVMPWTLERCLFEMDRIISDHVDLFSLLHGGGLSATLVRNMYAYILRQKAQLPAQAIAQATGVPVRTINHRNYAFAHLLKDPSFAPVRQALKQ